MNEIDLTDKILCQIPAVLLIFSNLTPYYDEQRGNVRSYLSLGRPFHNVIPEKSAPAFRYSISRNLIL